VYIDGPNGVSVDDCATVSRQLSAVLDVEDPLPGQYVLEVSSPGLDRPLVRPEDFRRFAGQEAKLRMAQPVNGRRNFTGRIAGVTGGNVALETSEGRVELALDQIETARLVPQL
jgi:ribosome maturation factor RimP